MMRCITRVAGAIGGRKKAGMTMRCIRGEAGAIDDAVRRKTEVCQFSGYMK